MPMVDTTAQKRKRDEIEPTSIIADVQGQKNSPKKRGLELVREEGNEDVFNYLMETCYGAPLQRHVWLQGLRTRQFQDVITSYDEALVLLLIENNLLLWKNMHSSNTLKLKEVTARPVYTTARGKGVGWSKFGILRFNTLVATVEGQRKAKKMKIQEAEFVARYKTKKKGNRGMPVGMVLGMKEIMENEVVPVFALPKKRMEETGGNGSEETGGNGSE